MRTPQIPPLAVMARRFIRLQVCEEQSMSPGGALFNPAIITDSTTATLHTNLTDEAVLRELVDWLNNEAFQ